MSISDFYSIKEFANKLGVHPNTIRRMIKSKRIEPIILNKGKRKSYRISYSEIGRMAKFDLDEYIKKEVETILKNTNVNP